VQITPNDSGAATGQLNSLDLKVSQLITNLANKPLLIEKLILNQTQGILLQLLDGGGKLNLQLPLQATNLFQSIASNNQNSPVDAKLTLSITSQQLLKIVLNAPQTQTNTQSPQTTNNAILPSMIFQKASLLPGQIIKLDKPIQSKNPPKLSGTASQAIKSDVNQTQNISGVRNFSSDSNLQKLNSSVTVQSNPNTNQNNPSVSGKDSIINSSIKTNQKQPSSLNQSSSINRSSNSQLTDKISVASAAKQLLSQQFPKQLPLAQHINNVSQLVKPLESAEYSTPAIKKLLQQINNMLASLSKPNNLSSGEIKQRIEQSGHKLEINLTNEQKLTSSETSATPNKNNQPNIIKQLRQIASGQISLDNNNSSPLIKKDLKLQLMQIRASLESLITSSLKNAGGSTTNTAQARTGTAAEATATNQTPASTSSSQSPERQLLNGLIQKGNMKQNVIVNQKLINQQSFVFKQSSELLAEVKNIISQIETNQLLSIKSDQPNLHQFLVDLPFTRNSQIDSFELLFEHSNSEKNSKPTKHWKVVVRFDLEPLGPMFAQVELVNDRLSTHIFAQSRETAKLIDDNLHVLKQSLFAAGLDTEKVTGSQGNIPEKLLLDNERKIDTHV